MKCQKCKSDRVINIYSKGSDLHTVTTPDATVTGYLPDDLGVGGGDDTTFDVCLECGQVQGKWPLPKAAIELYGTAYPPEEYEDEDEIVINTPPKLSWAERKKRAAENKDG